MGIRAVIGFNEDERATADFQNSGTSRLVITNFDNEMLALYRGKLAVVSGYLGDVGRRRRT